MKVSYSLYYLTYLKTLGRHFIKTIYIPDSDQTSPIKIFVCLLRKISLMQYFSSDVVLYSYQHQNIKHFFPLKKLAAHKYIEHKIVQFSVIQLASYSYALYLRFFCFFFNTVFEINVFLRIGHISASLVELYFENFDKGTSVFKNDFQGKHHLLLYRMLEKNIDVISACFDIIDNTIMLFQVYNISFF